MGWEDDYSYRVPCQPLEGPDAEIVLVFDLDNYVGHAINKTEEVIVARKQLEMETDNSGKSYFYPPEDDDEPQEIKDMEEKFQKAVEVNKKIFGVPAFEHTSFSLQRKEITKRKHCISRTSTRRTYRSNSLVGMRPILKK